MCNIAVPCLTVTTTAHHDGTDVGYLGRRERKKRETHDALRNAALRLALAHGYDHLTVEAITEAADVSTRTFFNHFASKDDALLGIDPERTRDVVEQVLARPAGESPVQSLRAVYLAYADRVATDAPLWQARMDVVRANPQLWPRVLASFAEMEQLLADVIARRCDLDATTDLYPGMLAASVVGAVRVAVAHWQRSPEAASFRELLDHAFSLVEHGFPLASAAGTSDL